MWHIPGSGTSIPRYSQAVFQSGCAHFCLHQRSMRVPATPLPCLCAVSSVLPGTAILARAEWQPTVIFLCLSLVAKDAKHIFVGLSEIRGFQRTLDVKTRYHALPGGGVRVPPATLWSSSDRSLCWGPRGHWGGRMGWGEPEEEGGRCVLWWSPGIAGRASNRAAPILTQHREMPVVRRGVACHSGHAR